jgi:hypothetical protein
VLVGLREVRGNAGFVCFGLREGGITWIWESGRGACGGVGV